MSDFSVWCQIPQYLLIGISEILTAITTYDLFYSQVPTSMRSVCQALNLMTVTLGSLVSSAVLSILSTVSTGGTTWFQNNLNFSRLDYVYFVFAAMMVVNLGCFIKSARSFRYKDRHAALADLVLNRSSSTHSRHSIMGPSFVETSEELYQKSIPIVSFVEPHFNNGISQGASPEFTDEYSRSYSLEAGGGGWAGAGGWSDVHSPRRTFPGRDGSGSFSTDPSRHSIGSHTRYSRTSYTRTSFLRGSYN